MKIYFIFLVQKLSKELMIYILWFISKHTETPDLKKVFRSNICHLLILYEDTYISFRILYIYIYKTLSQIKWKTYFIFLSAKNSLNFAGTRVSRTNICIIIDSIAKDYWIYTPKIQKINQQQNTKNHKYWNYRILTPVVLNRLKLHD